MSIATANHISKSFGAEDIFWDISLPVPHGARIALVGPNGAGKTTLLRILIGEDAPTSGTVHRARGLTIGYLPQEAEHAFHDEGETLKAAMLAVFTDLRRQEAALRRMEQEMALPGAAESLLDEYGAALERFELQGGYEYEVRVRQVLAGLGFPESEHQTPIAHLSGGQKTRALLARLLLQSPQLLVMDEPTNHLDIEAIEWLEKQLINWPGSLLIVSHDRYFLDRVVNRVYELDWGEIESYRGNYSAYAKQRVDRTERRLAEYKAQQDYIAKEADFIRRNMAGQRTKEAQGRLKRLERLKRDHLLRAPRAGRRLNLRFQDSRRSGDIILQTQDLVVGYSSAAPLFRADDIDFRRTECAALIGPNGSGKTSFLRTILGELNPLSGRLRHGASLEVGYFAQAHDALDIESGRTVLEELLFHDATLTSEARDYLARFLFTGDDVFKPLGALSGGERGRLALALLMRQRVNFLLLDEPTNHLDIPAQEVLEDVINDFDGTVILVSHDRYLVSRLATQIWVLDGNRLRVYKGNYQEYVAAREREAAEAVEVASQRRNSARHEARESREQIAVREARQSAQRTADLETSIHRLEAQLASLFTELDSASQRQAFDQVRQLKVQYNAVEAELEQCLTEWARVAGGTYESE